MFYIPYIDDSITLFCFSLTTAISGHNSGVNQILKPILVWFSFGISNIDWVFITL